MATLIFIFSLGALGQFAVAYCRTLLLAYNKVELSARVREITGVDEGVAGNDFHSLLNLVSLAPALGDDAAEIRAVKIYYRLTRAAGALVSPFSKAASQWFKQELKRCSYFVVVTLDRRLSTTARGAATA
jgi:hypothetical protein